MRHRLLAAEMSLRGYHDRTPLRASPSSSKWPTAFVTEPSDQFILLIQKYSGREAGRIPLPKRTQDLWAQHKYSVMARDPAECKAIGRRVARLRGDNGLRELAADLTIVLRKAPSHGRLVNAVEHMWGHVAEFEPGASRRAEIAPPALLRRTQELALEHRERFLLASTALSELAAFIRQ